MPDYIRSHCPGGTFFFALVTYNRRTIFESPLARRLLRQAWILEMLVRPFIIEAICLLPEHIHCMLRLPEGDGNYSLRLGAIKARFTQVYLKYIGHVDSRNESRIQKGERTVWQRRFWEHTIRDDDDFRRHVEYIHYNPVKHGLVTRVVDWPWSSFHRHVRQGIYSSDWGGDVRLDDGMPFGE